MDFPSASTFGLMPSRRTAISFAIELTDELIAGADMAIADLEELSELLEDELEGEVTFEVVFEPWDEEMDAYVIGELDEDPDEGDEDDEEEDFRC